MSEKNISFCLAHYNRLDRLMELVNVLRQFDQQICIANFVNKGIGLPSYRQDGIVVVNVKKKFSKSFGMNRAADQAENTILCFLDVDMVVPDNFPETIRDLVEPGSCYFPICFSLYEGKPMTMENGNGYWRDKGYGNCAFTSDDLRELGGWDESFTSWGGEDTELFNRARANMLVHRQRCEGLFHRWHPKEIW